MLFKEVEKLFYPLRWVHEKLVFSSVLGGAKLANSSFITSAKVLEDELNRTEMMEKCVLSGGFESKVRYAMAAFRDIRGTLELLKKGVTLSELDLFEIKYFSYYYDKFAALLKDYSAEIYRSEDIKSVFQMLDPDRTDVVSFYIYDSYDDRLSDIRKAIKAAEYNGKPTEALYVKLEDVQREVREWLSRDLRDSVDKMLDALNHIAKFDLLLAKTVFANEYGGIRPVLVQYGHTEYVGLVNPYLRSTVEQRGDMYQAIDIELRSSPTMITGANMSGKTMVLKSVALAQYLVQFGFKAPAATASVALVKDVILLIGDAQNEDRGLSSFGGEILAISDMIERVFESNKDRYLVLLDEPARTTSPSEGAAIVDGVVELLQEQGVMSLVTTHYSKLKNECRCLRVRGFKENMRYEAVNCKNINSFIDYTLEESSIEQGCSEALRVAELLGVTDKLIAKLKL